MIKELNSSLKILKNGQTLLYPTDTVWGIGCDATNFNAVQKIYKIKQREDSKTMICLVKDLKMLSQFIEEIPEAAKNILKYAQKPTTIIYDLPKHMAQNLIANDNTIGIRIVKDEFCFNLIKLLKKPIVSTSANVSGKPTPKSFKEIETEIIKGVDYVVNLKRESLGGSASSIIKLSQNGEVKIIRP
nr:translation factor Sua5 [uncultured bacterium]